MTLTLAHGPLSGAPSDANYRIDGPAHRLFFEPFARRVRAVYGGDTVLDSSRARLLHETGLLPQLYVPLEDVRRECLEGSDHTTRCPFKGVAQYWSVRVGDAVAENAVWAYPEPEAAASWLAGFAACYWGAMDAWYDEDEQVHGHIRDPYHRVDVRATSRRVRVTANGETIADSRRAMLLSETGLPNRFYLPARDVTGALEPSSTVTVCPYKGTASYRTVVAGGRRLEDAAWQYAKPLEPAHKIGGYLCFLHDGLTLEVDGAPAD